MIIAAFLELYFEPVKFLHFEFIELCLVLSDKYDIAYNRYVLMKIRELIRAVKSVKSYLIENNLQQLLLRKYLEVNDNGLKN